MRITTGGFVGIGTTDPAHHLEVTGSLRADSIVIGTDTVYEHSLNLHNDGTIRIGNAEMIDKVGNDLELYQGKLYIQNGGNVGIGTTDPASKLHIQDTNDTVLTIAGGSGGGSSVGYIDFYSIAGAKNIARIEADRGTANANGVLTLHIADASDAVAERMRIDSDGNVGIGTNNPQELLHIDGSSPRIRLRDSDAAGTPYAHIDASDGALLIEADKGDETASSYIALTVDGSESIRAIAAGNVGIGTTDPDGKLHVETAVSSQTASTQADELIVENSTHGGISILTPDASRAHLYFNQGAFLRWQNSLFTIDTSNSAHHLALKAGGGNVGIGTTSPDSPLELEVATAGNTQTRLAHFDHNPTGNTGSGFLRLSSGSNNASSLHIEQVSSGGGSLYGTYSDTNFINNGTQTSGAYNNINFVTNDAIRMTVGGGSQAGKIGIGTTTPSEQLTNYSASGNVTTLTQVGGSGNADLQLKNNSGDRTIRATSDKLWFID
jgi:hypothetical protein